MTAAPPKFCAFDVEGDAGERGIQGVAIYSDRTQVYIDNAYVAISELIKHGQDGYTLIAHNAEYDVSVLLWHCRQKVEITYYGRQFNHARWMLGGKKKSVSIVDSMGFAPGMSVKALGKSIGLEKYETPQKLLGKDPDRYKWECEKHQRWECFECYALRDAEIVYKFTQAYVEYLAQYGIPFKRRLGSAAVAMWRVMDGYNDVAIRSHRIEALAREAYHGGRVEVFRYGNVGQCYNYDVTNMYGYVMQTAPMPDMFAIHYAEGFACSADNFNYEGVSYARFTVPASMVPVLPVVYSDKLYFPVGDIAGAFTHAEIRAAISRGARVERIERQVYSTKIVFPFSTFVGTVFAQREQYRKLNDPREQVAKTMINALYGRLGLRPNQERVTMVPIYPGEHFSDYQGYAIDLMGESVVARKETMLPGISKQANVLWAAQVTAYARLKLLGYLEAAGNGLIYCDTDGVITDQKIEQDNPGIGALTLRGEYQQGYFGAPKVYTLENVLGEQTVRVKGVPRAVAAEYVKTGHAAFSAPFRVMESFRRGTTPGVWRVIDKYTQNAPAKRHLLDPDAFLIRQGFSGTSPIVFVGGAPEGSDDDGEGSESR